MEPETPSQSMYAIIPKEKGSGYSSYSNKYEAPLTLVADKATADTVKELLTAAKIDTLDVVEVPVWPQMRKVDGNV